MARFFQTLKKRLLRPDKKTVEVVFARTSLESSDPIVAVLSSEEEVLQFRLDLVKQWPELELSWSDHVVRGAPLDFDGVVHFVTECGPLSPVVVAAFASAPDAVRFAFKQERLFRARTRRYTSTPNASCPAFEPRLRGPAFTSDIHIRSLPIGWRAPGEPWLEFEDDK